MKNHNFAFNDQVIHVMIFKNGLSVLANTL